MSSLPRRQVLVTYVYHRHLPNRCVHLFMGSLHSHFYTAPHKNQMLDWRQWEHVPVVLDAQAVSSKDKASRQWVMCIPIERWQTEERTTQARTRILHACPEHFSPSGFCACVTSVPPVPLTDTRSSCNENTNSDSHRLYAICNSTQHALYQK